jgi:Zn finger protein HypA/HybF involved in hydrogenase expression
MIDVTPHSIKCPKCDNGYVGYQINDKTLEYKVICNKCDFSEVVFDLRLI